MSFLGAMAIEAVFNLRVSPMRTALALIGVAIGCAAVVTILQIGLIAERQILRDLEQAGLNLIQISPSYGRQGPENETPPLSVRAAEIEAELESLSSIGQAALLKVHGTGVFIRDDIAKVEVLGITPALLDIVNLTLADGNFDALSMGSAPVGVVGGELTTNLERPVKIEVGDHLHIGVDGYKVGGVLAPAAYNSMIGVDFGRSLLIPERSIERLVQNTKNWRLILEAEPSASMEAVEEAVRTLFRDQFGIDIKVHTAETIIATKQAQQRSLTLLLAALGVVSLIVGMVGVTNVMLASVAERRREIGLRMAIGASPGDIRILFLIEAIVLCIFGGMVGTLIGVIGSNLYASVSLTDLTVSYEILGFALVMSTLTGLIAGYYPAQKSSQLDPIEALQSQ